MEATQKKKDAIRVFTYRRGTEQQYSSGFQAWDGAPHILGIGIPSPVANPGVEALSSSIVSADGRGAKLQADAV